MTRFGCLATLLVALLLTACGQESAPPAPPAKPPVAEAPKPAQPAAEQPAQPATVVEEKVAAGAAAVAEKAPVSEAVTQQAGQQAAAAAPQVEKAPAPAPAAKPAAETKPAPATTPPAAKPPGTVTYQASMGTVTFDHAGHSGELACSRCHTTDPPQAIAMSKAVAHDQLCKVCHKESGADAPTACNGCHKK